MLQAADKTYSLYKSFASINFGSSSGPKDIYRGEGFGMPNNLSAVSIAAVEIIKYWVKHDKLQRVQFNFSGKTTDAVIQIYKIKGDQLFVNEINV